MSRTDRQTRLRRRKEQGASAAAAGDRIGQAIADGEKVEQSSVLAVRACVHAMRTLVAEGVEPVTAIGSVTALVVGGMLGAVMEEARQGIQAAIDEATAEVAAAAKDSPPNP